MLGIYGFYTTNIIKLFKKYYFFLDIDSQFIIFAYLYGVNRTKIEFSMIRFTRIIALVIALVVIATPLMAQSVANGAESEPTPFNGLIINNEGKGIKARVEVKNCDKFTISDKRGRFGLTNIEPNDTLLITYKRMAMEIPIEGRRGIKITINNEFTYDANEDEEIANIGFGYVKRRESTQFTSGISGDRLRATGCTNVIDAIAICYPALQKVGNSLYLRGSNSILGTSEVLILCDGVDTNIHAINLHDIESVEIIKDSNIYGFRGVNGVVLITTKR